MVSTQTRHRHHCLAGLVSLLNCHNDLKWQGECLALARLSLLRLGFLQWPWNCHGVHWRKNVTWCLHNRHTDRQTDTCWAKKNSIIVSNDEPDSYRHYTEGRTECNQSPITLGDGNLSCRWPCEQRNICQSDALALAQMCYLWSTHMPLLSRQVYHTGRSRRVCLTCWGSIHELFRLDPHPVQYQCFRPVIWWKKPKSPKQMGV